MSKLNTKVDQPEALIGLAKTLALGTQNTGEDRFPIQNGPAKDMAPW